MVKNHLKTVLICLPISPKVNFVQDNHKVMTFLHVLHQLFVSQVCQRAFYSARNFSTQKVT
jgi:hypothetical protein